MKKFMLKSIERLLISFLVVLCIPTISTLVSYRQSAWVVTENTKDYTRAMLEQMRTAIDSRWEKFDSTLYELNQTPRIINYLYFEQPLSDSAYYALWDIQRTIKPYALVDDAIEEMGVYFENSQSLVLTTFVSTLGDFYEKNLRSPQSLEEIQAALPGTGGDGLFLEKATLLLNGREMQVFPYILKLPTDTGDQGEGYVFFLLNAQAVERTLRQVDAFQQGNVYVSDGENIIWSIVRDGTGAHPQGDFSRYSDFYNEGERVVAYISSLERNLKYVIQIPSEVILSDVEQLRSTSMILLASTIALGIVVAVFASIVNTKPLKRVVNRLSSVVGEQGQKDRNEYRYLEGSINTLIRHNDQLEHIVSEHALILQMEFLNNLYRGEYADDGEIKDALESMGIQIADGNFRVLIAVLAEGWEYLDRGQRQMHQDKSNGKLLLMEILHGIGAIHCSLFDKDKVAVLINSAGVDEPFFHDNVEKIAAQVKVRMTSEFGISVSFFGGGVCMGLSQVSRSFSEARSAYEYFWDSGESRGVFWQEDIPQKGATRAYAVDMQVRLINTVSAGKQQDAAALLRRIFEENFSSPMPLGERVSLLLEMRGTLSKLYEKFKLEQEMVPVSVSDCSQGDETMYNLLAQSFLNLSDLVSRQREEKAARLKEDVIEYIEQNFRDPNLSLSMICQSFSMGEVALSQFFKNQTGETVSQYIEDKRIAMACSMLDENEYSIAEIATLSGYNSDKSFRRAFKRNKGVSPTEYRSVQ